MGRRPPLPYRLTRLAARAPDAPIALVAFEVSIRRTDSAMAELRVTDSGIGIGEEFLETLFDAFRQESEGADRSDEGSSLGLSISKQLVDMVGRTIEVESEKGVGSTFTMLLPLAGTA